MYIFIRNFTVYADDHLSKLKKLPTLDFQRAKAGSSRTAYPSEMEFQIAYDVDIVTSPRKPSLCSAEIPLVADMQLQVDFACWKFWGFVRDFAKEDYFCVPISVSDHFIRQLLSAFLVFGIKLGNRCGFQVWEIFIFWTCSKQAAQFSKDLGDSYVFTAFRWMSSRYYGVLQKLLTTSFMATWILERILLTTGISPLQHYLREQELFCWLVRQSLNLLLFMWINKLLAKLWWAINTEFLVFQWKVFTVWTLIKILA